MKNKLKKLLGLFIELLPLIALTIVVGSTYGREDIIRVLGLLGIAIWAVICCLVGIDLLNGDV